MLAPKVTDLVISDLDELFDSHSKQAYARAVCHPQLCAAIREVACSEALNYLASHKCVSVRAALAGNKNLSDEIVWPLTCDESLPVRLQLARNPFLANFVLETLGEDEDQRVAAAANKTLARRRRSASFNNIVGFFSTNRLPNAG